MLYYSIPKKMNEPHNNSIEGNNKRDVSIDAARGVALFLVVLSHAHHCPHYLTAFYIMAFFFLSGWLYKSGRSYVSNIKKKASRVLIPYFVNSIILLLFFALVKSFSIEQVMNALRGIFYSRECIFPNGGGALMGSIANNPLWYFTAFFSTSLLFHLIVDWCSQYGKRLMLACLTLIAISIILAKLPILLPWSLDMVPFFTVVMLLGYEINKHKEAFSFSWINAGLLLMGYLALCLENGPVGLSMRDYGWGGQFSTLIIGVTGTLFTLILCKKIDIKWIKWFFVKIGTNSIVVLSFHLALFSIYGTIIRTVHYRVFSSDIHSSIIIDIVIVIFSILTCILIGSIMDIIKRKKEKV